MKRTETPYGDAAKSYIRKGWRAIPTRGGGTLKGVTGYQGQEPSIETYKRWIERHAKDNIGIVMPGNVIAIDVDLKVNEETGETVDGWTEETQALLDALPLTWTNGHGDPASPYRHYLYRVPEGVTPEDVAAIGQGLGKGVDLIKWCHRWLRVGPSIHKSGEVYEWRDPSGEECKIPTPDILPVLTDAQWSLIVERAGTSGSSGHYAAADVDVQGWLDAHAGKPDTEMQQAFYNSWQDRNEARHDAASRTTMRVAHLAEEGHPGARAVLKRLRKEFLDAVADEREGGRHEAEEEFSRLVVSAIGKAVTKTQEGDRSAPVPEVTTLPNPFEQAGDDPAEPGDDEPDDSDFADPYEHRVTVDTVEFAAEYAKRHHTEAPLFYENQRFWVWKESEKHYVEYERDHLAADIAENLRHATEIVRVPDGPPTIERVKVKETTASKVVTALSQTQYARPGSLLPGVGGVPFLDGWLDIATGELLPIGPSRDVRWNTGVCFTGASNDVTEWSKFLDSIGWGPESAERRLLAQWIGYLLSGSTEHHKMLLLLGPPRSGKGTIEKVIMALFGDGATGADVSMFENDHGPSALVGKSVALFDDVRFDRVDAKVRRALLTISSFGPSQINPKHKDLYSVVLPTRLVMCTNNTPSFTHESTTALADRFHVLKTLNGFTGREDTGLLKRLIRELPGIVMWGLDGLRDLEDNGWAVSGIGQEIVEAMQLSGSQVRQFVEDMVIFDPDAKISVDDLYRQYQLWAPSNGINSVMTKRSFGADFKDAYGDKVTDTKLQRGSVRAYRGCTVAL